MRSSIKGVVALAFLLASFSNSLKQPINNICIVGCGIAGLTTALALQRQHEGRINKQLASPSTLNIQIFDSRNGNNLVSSRLGGGLQVSGGAQVLRKIDDTLLSKFTNIALELNDIKCTNSASDLLYHLSIMDLFKNDESPLVYTIMRDSLLSLLYNELIAVKSLSSKSCSISIHPNYELKSIDEDLSKGKVSVSFTNGESVGDFDFVIGADGINSITKKHVISSQSNSNSYFPFMSKLSDISLPSYSGIRITYLITPPQKSPRSQTIQQHMGDGLYALVANYGGKEGFQSMIALVYHENSDSLFGDNSKWQESDISSITKEALLERLRRAKLGDQKELSELLDLVFSDNNLSGRIFDLGVRDILLSSLVTPWSTKSGRVTLLGDAAHPMAPFLGQGANQAMVDAYTLASLITEYNYSEQSEIVEISKSFQRLRKLPTILLAIKSNILGRIETLEGIYGMLFKDTFFRLVSRIGIIAKEFRENALPHLS